MLELSTLLSVMRESSKRVSETLQEIYSSDWDGHEELKAIVGVRVFWALQLFHTHSCPHLNLIVASPSEQTGKQRGQFTLFVHLYGLSHGW